MSGRSIDRTRKTRGETSRAGFTLIELLVVIAIIAVLISVLLPALSSARKHGQATKCAANLHHVGQAMGGYLADNQGIYPPSYIYPYDGAGNYDLNDQPNDHPFGYLHWSWFLYSQGQAPEESFRCPSMENGGAPRTNPGPRDWEKGQVDQNNTGSPNTLEDRQAPRLAYAGNAAIFPRNKFNYVLSGGPRVNVCVNETKIHDPARVVLCAELNKNWKAAGIEQGNGVMSKSHRPINPFWHLGAGSNEYAAAPETPGFTYGNSPYHGLLPLRDVEEAAGLIDNPGVVETNAVGRHHPGGDAYMGGTANFAYADGHVDRKTVLETIRNQEWGNRYYAITGKNKIGPPWTAD